MGPAVDELVARLQRFGLLDDEILAEDVDAVILAVRRVGHGALLANLKVGVAFRGLLLRPHNMLLTIGLDMALNVQRLDRFLLLAQFDDASVDLHNLAGWLVSSLSLLGAGTGLSLRQVGPLVHKGAIRG